MAVLLPSPFGTYQVRHRALTLDTHGQPVPGSPTVEVSGLAGRTHAAGTAMEIYLDPAAWPACDVETLANTAEVLVVGPDPDGTVRTWIVASAAMRRGDGPAGALDYVTASGVRAEL